MKTFCLPTVTAGAESLGGQRFRPEAWQLFAGATVLLWYGGAACCGDHNGYTMAVWYIVSYLLVPMLAFSAGGIWFALRSRVVAESIPRLLLRHLGALTFAFFLLPLLLSGLNRIPVGQTTTRWIGQLVSHEPIPVLPLWRYQLLLKVKSDSLGPWLQFIEDRIAYVPEKAGPRELPPVSGTVVKGFLGLPLAVRIDPVSAPVNWPTPGSNKLSRPLL